MSDDEASEPEIVSSLPQCDDVEECRGHWDALDDQINVRILCRNVRLAVLLFQAEGKEDDRYHPIHDINEKIRFLLKFFCRLNIKCMNGIETAHGNLPIHCVARELYRCFQFSLLWSRGKLTPICREAVQKNDANKHIFWKCVESFIEAGMNPHVKNTPTVPIFRPRSAFDIIFRGDGVTLSEIEKVYDAAFWVKIYHTLKAP